MNTNGYTLRVRLGLAALMGLCGGAIAQLAGTSRPDFLISAVVGAFVAGFTVLALFGAEGYWGWIRAAVGGILATFLGAALAVVLWTHGGSNVMLGPLMVFMVLAESQLALFIWVGMMSAIHLSARAYWRRRKGP